GACYFCRHGNFHKCDGSRTFGHGATLGSLQGTQADKALVPKANLTLRRVPEGLSKDVALFAGDVMGTGYHATQQVRPGDTAVVLASKCGVVAVIGVYAERCEVHMGLLWIKALRMETGHANVIGHLDKVLALMASGDLNPAPLVTHHMKLDDAPEAYGLYDRR